MDEKKVERILINGAYILSAQDSSRKEREAARSQIKALIKQARKAFKSNQR